MALPSDRLKDILGGFDSYAIATRWYRLSRQMLGEGRGRKLEGHRTRVG